MSAACIARAAYPRVEAIPPGGGQSQGIGFRDWIRLHIRIAIQPLGIRRRTHRGIGRSPARRIRGELAVEVAVKLGLGIALFAGELVLVGIVVHHHTLAAIGIVVALFDDGSGLIGDDGS